MRVALCLCELIPRLELATKLVVIKHQRETYSTTNTSRLAVLALPNSETRIRGLPGICATESLRFAGGEALVLFPSEDAELLDSRLVASLARPVTLIVPDGNWRQASRMIKREPGLSGLKRVKLPFAGPSRYQLRKSPGPEALCTLEAIAAALGVLEGPEARASLDRLFQLMVERTLWSRGAIRASQARFELPSRTS